MKSEMVAHAREKVNQFKILKSEIEKDINMAIYVIEQVKQKIKDNL